MSYSKTEEETLVSLSLHLLRTTNTNFLFFVLARRLTVQPEDDEGQKAADDGPQAGDPRPGPRNAPTARPLVVCEVSDRDLTLFLDVGQEGTFVVDFEHEDAVLVWCAERRAEDRAIGCAGGRVQRDTVER